MSVCGSGTELSQRVWSGNDRSTISQMHCCLVVSRRGTLIDLRVVLTLPKEGEISKEEEECFLDGIINSTFLQNR